MYRIRILESATRELARLDKSIGHRVVEKINWLSKNVDAIRSEKLSGELAGLYKLRVGDYRIIYEILHDEKVILIHAIGHRKEIYRIRH